MTEVITRDQHNALDRARQLEQEIEKGADLIRGAWFEMAARLWEFNDIDGWKALGYDSLDEWCAGPGIDLKRSQVRNLLQVWGDLVVNRGVDPAELHGVDASKALVVLPAIRKRTVSTEDALADARALSRSDLKAKYGRGRDPNAGLNAEAEPEWTKCPTCGQRTERSRLQEAA